MHTPRIDNDDKEDDENTTYNTTTNTTATTSNSSSSTTNKRQRSSTPEQPLAGLNTVSPKRTMSEEHLYSRESSPIVSLPTGGSQSGSVSGNGSGDNAAVPQVPTKMTEVFPPSTSMTNGQEVQEGMSSESIGSGSTATRVISDLLPVETGAQGATSMDVDQDERGMTNGSGLSSGNGSVESRNVPSLHDQLDLIKREYRGTCSCPSAHVSNHNPACEGLDLTAEAKQSCFAFRCH